MMNDTLKTTLAELRRRFEALYGMRLVRLVLFGSQARQDAEPGADIDILVVLQGRVDPGEEVARTGEIVTSLSLRFDTVISCVFMEEERFSLRNGPLLRNIRREGIAV